MQNIKKYFMTLALLLTAATGAWAQSTELTEWELKPDADKKVWTLAKMPAGNVELQVAYYPAMLTLAASPADGGKVELDAAAAPVEWTPETWTNVSTQGQHDALTSGDITLSTTDGWLTKASDGNLTLYSADNEYDHQTLTFSTTGDGFTRIELTMTSDASNHNPHITPADGWTFSGKSAVWEGEATKSLVCQNCTTTVSKITFYRGSGLPTGVEKDETGNIYVKSGTTVTVKATPEEGYRLVSLSDGTNTYDFDANGIATVTMPEGDADLTITATFAENEYNITFVEGTNPDPENPEWTATPNPAKTKQTVTVTYTGTKKVIGVKAEKVTYAEGHALSAAVVGELIGSDGKAYAADDKDNLPKGVTALALVCYVGEAGTADAGSSTYKGLALALTEANNGDKVAWCSLGSETCLNTQCNNADNAKNDMNGIANTDALIGHVSHTHAIASAARNYNGGTHPTGTSAWFLPSAGQWEKMATVAGSLENLRNGFEVVGGTNMQDANYSSSTENESYNIWTFRTSWTIGGKGVTRYVRPCLAF